jgi:hypothetical protein
MREPEAAAGGSPTHVLVLATLGAPERRLLSKTLGKRQAKPWPEPAPVMTSRATIIDVAAPLDTEQQARAWLHRAGERELAAGLEVLNRALHAFRLVTADPYLNPIERRDALTARVGYGAGEEVADGLWTDARELITPRERQRRTRMLVPQARLAAALGGRERLLACEELALRARLDLDQGRPREAALQVQIGLEAALAELARDPAADLLGDRLVELEAQRDAVAAAAAAALADSLSDAGLDAVSFTLGRIEAALRARAAANA